jgi:hypothetical protein
MNSTKQERYKMKIDEVEINLLQLLFHDGWALKLEDDISEDFKCFCAFKKEGPMDAFTRLDVTLFTLDNNPEDVAIRFLFQTDQDKWSLGKKVQENNCEALRLTCEYLLNKSGMDAEERQFNIGARSGDSRGFDNGIPGHINSAYKVELVYGKQL